MINVTLILELFAIILTAYGTYEIRERLIRRNKRKNLLHFCKVECELLDYNLLYDYGNNKIKDKYEYRYLMLFRDYCLDGFYFKSDEVLKRTVGFLTVLERPFLKKFDTVLFTHKLAYLRIFTKFIDKALKNKTYFFFKTYNFDFKFTKNELNFSQILDEISVHMKHAKNTDIMF